MNARVWITLAIAAAGCLTGCTQPPGELMALDEVPFDQAFQVSREVLTQYNFSIEEEEPSTGLLVSRPQFSEAYLSGRILTPSTQRKIAKIQLRQDGQSVNAEVWISIERLVTGAEARAPGVSPDDYSGVPNQTPSQEMAATTAEQNRTWTLVRYDRALAQQVLNEIYRKLHPPTSQPANNKPAE